MSTIYCLIRVTQYFSFVNVVFNVQQCYLEWSIQGGPFQCTIFRPYLSTVVLNHPVIGTYSAIFCLSLLVICKLVLVTEILLT